MLDALLTPEFIIFISEVANPAQVRGSISQKVDVAEKAAKTHVDAGEVSGVVLVSVSENAPGCRHRRGAIRGYDSGSLLTCRRYEHSGARRGMHANERQYIVAIVGTPRFGSLRCLGAYLLNLHFCESLRSPQSALDSVDFQPLGKNKPQQ